MDEGTIEDERGDGLGWIEMGGEVVEGDLAFARPVAAGVRKNDGWRRQRRVTEDVIEEGERAAGILRAALDQVAPEAAAVFGRRSGVDLQRGVPAVFARYHDQPERAGAGERTQPLHAVGPIADAAHHADDDEFGLRYRRLQVEVDGKRVGEAAEIGEADSWCIGAPLHRRGGQRSKFGVRGGEKDDVAGRLAEIDGGIAVVDAGNVAGEEMHR